MLEAEIGRADPSPPAALEDVRLPEARPLPDAVLRAAGEDALFAGREDRIRHAAGRSYPDLVRLRAGEPAAAPDAVIVPADAEAVRRVLAACSEARVAVVPFGGGTSVVGGVEPLAGGCEAVVSLDLCAMRAAPIDRRSLTARLGPGLRGPEAEAQLAAAGLTLGHFPQSYRYATIGGFAAARSAGQASSGYGRFDELVTQVEVATPAGALRTLETPHSAAGPSLRELVLGSEGALGVITEVGVRVRPAPEERRYEAWFAPDFATGVDAARALAQGDALPDVLRLSDREETRVSLALGGGERLSRTALDAYLRLRGRAEGCIVICGWEGKGETVRHRRRLAARILRAGGAVSLGRAPGRAWERGRYDGPYLRDALMDVGAMVDTLETAHSWARLGDLYERVREAIAGALAAAGTPGLVLCHVSHVYRDGASLYYTFIARRRPGEEIEQWRAVKHAASEAIVATGGTITHHHGVGRDHAPYLRSEVGEVGVEALRAVKERLDPAGIMNPGKLVGGPGDEGG